MRKKIGYTMMAAGLLLLLAAGSLLFVQHRAAQEADRQAQILLAHGQQAWQTRQMEQTEALTPPSQMEPLLVDGLECAGLLQIPALEREIPVLMACTAGNLQTAPCCYAGTIAQRNLVIAGHNYKRHFGGLDRLAQGDAVVFTDSSGVAFQYQVECLEVLAPEQVAEMVAGDYDLSLFTCTPGGRSRFTVRCNLVS